MGRGAEGVLPRSRIGSRPGGRQVADTCSVVHDVVVVVEEGVISQLGLHLQHLEARSTSQDDSYQTAGNSKGQSRIAQRDNGNM